MNMETMSQVMNFHFQMKINQKNGLETKKCNASFSLPLFWCNSSHSQLSSSVFPVHLDAFRNYIAAKTSLSMNDFATNYFILLLFPVTLITLISRRTWSRIQQHKQYSTCVGPCVGNESDGGGIFIVAVVQINNIITDGG